MGALFHLYATYEIQGYLKQLYVTQHIYVISGVEGYYFLAWREFPI